MSSSGGHVRTIHTTTYKEGQSPQPVFTANGKSIIFDTSNTDSASNGNTDLYSVPVHGGPLTQLTDDPNDSAEAHEAPPVTLCSVPDLTGQTLAKAKQLLQRNACLRGNVYGPKNGRSKLHVVHQNPTANQNLPRGTRVDIQLK